MLGLYAILAENMPQIKTNSFYDVFEEYSEEERKKYEHMAGIESASIYDKLIQKN